MALERPRGPEPVNFDDYCDLLPSAMPRDLIEKNKYYTARILEDPLARTNEVYAHDYLSIVFEAEDRFDLTVITLGLYLLHGNMKRRERAVENVSNLIFRYDGLGSTVGSELGYFIGLEGGVRNAGAVPRTKEVDDDEPEMPTEPVEARRLLVATT